MWMSSLTLAWLGGAMVVYLAASSVLRSYVANAQIGLLLGALVLYTMGNLMMVRLMRDSGMAVAISVSAVLQLVLATMVAVAFFGERPTGLQWAGIGFGVIAVALIVWPQQGAR
jgi:drug/metabolite transporter (DMT)-like permease